LYSIIEFTKEEYIEWAKNNPRNFDNILNELLENNIEIDKDIQL